jgi:NADPH-dependent 2,4-dienoyl-CoA reductase/sulfur reductase-like enzyme
MKVVIIGGSHAGIACAIRAKEENPESQIILYEKQNSIGFIAQSIPFYLTGDSNFLKMSSYITVSELEKIGIVVKTQTSVVDIEVDHKVISYIDLLDHSEKKESYDQLVLATGSYPSLPSCSRRFSR